MSKISFTSCTAVPGASPYWWGFSSVGYLYISASPQVWGIPWSNFLLSMLSQRAPFAIKACVWRLDTEGKNCDGNSTNKARENVKLSRDPIKSKVVDRVKLKRQTFRPTMEVGTRSWIDTKQIKDIFMPED